MNYNLTKPCKNCPFSTTCLNGWLGGPRATEIFYSISRDQKSFPCHKTTSHDDEGDYVLGQKEEHCAGALILLEKLELPNQMMRISERLGFYDRFKLNMNAPVFDSGAEFIRHHAEE